MLPQGKLLGTGVPALPQIRQPFPAYHIQKHSQNNLFIKKEPETVQLGGICHSLLEPIKEDSLGRAAEEMEVD